MHYPATLEATQPLLPYNRSNTAPDAIYPLETQPPAASDTRAHSTQHSLAMLDRTRPNASENTVLGASHVHDTHLADQSV